MSSPLMHESSGKVEKDLNSKTGFQADHYKPSVYGTEDSKVQFLDFTHGPPNVENSTLIACTETVSLRVTPDAHQPDLHVLDFVNAKDPKENIGKPRLEIRQCLDEGEKSTLVPLGGWYGGEVCPELYQLHSTGLFD
ncbi:hypothetical protein FRC10_008441 [Ceratobasidium sp. 414]|nr:hypothetical protein FRC10_008441 [Ceratobasidium sp. 414]